MNEYPEDFPPELAAILDALLLAIGALFVMLLNDRLTVTEWQSEMQGLLARYHEAAYMLGVNSETLTQFDLQTVDTFYLSQIAYLAAFALEMIAAGVILETLKARAEMYGGAICAPYWKGRTKGIDLPGYPGEDTECMSNCRCRWDVKTLDSNTGNYDAYWKLAGDTPDGRNCQTCLGRSRDWSPYIIRNNSPVLVSQNV